MKVLIANRGEIAVRIIRACRELGMPTVAVYSDCDRGARHVRDADQARAHRPQPGRRELSPHRRIDRGRAGAPAPTRCIPATASSPRTPRSRAACGDAGLTFIGPSPEAIALMGSKTGRARGRDPGRRAGRARHRTRRSARGAERRRSRAKAERVGYPLMVKAVAGGGGKGMRVVESPR